MRLIFTRSSLQERAIVERWVLRWWVENALIPDELFYTIEFMRVYYVLQIYKQNTQFQIRWHTKALYLPFSFSPLSFSKVKNKKRCSSLIQKVRANSKFFCKLTFQDFCGTRRNFANQKNHGSGPKILPKLNFFQKVTPEASFCAHHHLYMLNSVHSVLIS